MDRMPWLDKGKEPGTSNFISGNKTLDFFRPEQRSQKAPPLSPTLTTRKPEGFPSSQTLETNMSQITSFKGESTSALLRQINAANTAQRIIERDMRKRLTRITGRPDFLEANPKHPEVVKMQDAFTRKMQASQRGKLLDYYSAIRDLSAAEAELAKEAKMMGSLKRGVGGLKYIEDSLKTNDHAIHDETVMKSIHILNADLSRIQEKQNQTITQWENLKGDIEQCVGELKRHAPDLPLPELDKVLIFPKGKTKEKDEQSDKTEKETKKNEEKNSISDSLKKGDQPLTSGDHAESAAKTMTHQTLEISAEVKALHKNLENLIFRAQSLHKELTSLNNQWDNFAEKRKDQMDQLKSSHDLQSKRFSEAMSAITAGADKGQSDIATAMKYANKLVALAAITVGGGGLRLRM